MHLLRCCVAIMALTGLAPVKGDHDCGADEFRCADGKCISVSRFCDGKGDCNASDYETSEVCGNNSTTTTLAASPETGKRGCQFYLHVDVL